MRSFVRSFIPFNSGSKAHKTTGKSNDIKYTNIINFLMFLIKVDIISVFGQLTIHHIVPHHTAGFLKLQYVDGD